MIFEKKNLNKHSSFIWYGRSWMFLKMCSKVIEKSGWNFTSSTKRKPWILNVLILRMLLKWSFSVFKQCFCTGEKDYELLSRPVQQLLHQVLGSFLKCTHIFFAQIKIRNFWSSLPQKCFDLVKSLNICCTSKYVKILSSWFATGLIGA